jgi:conjugative transfer signal peptidase TraF
MKVSSVSTLAIAIMGIGLVGFSIVAHPRPAIIWNASASVPVGLYRVTSGLPRRSDLVLVRTPDFVMALADKRHYLPSGVPLVKRIAAVEGDLVCASKGVVAINGVKAVRQLITDRAGRLLPRWKGCQKLVWDEFFLLAEAPDSFDSRYFGPVKNTRVIGRLVPLWTR